MSTSITALYALELACAAHRVNKGYLKEVQITFDVNNQMVDQYANKHLMMAVTGHWAPPDGEAFPKIAVTDEDRQLAADIKQYFRRLVFAAVSNDSDYYTTLNIMFTNDEVPINKIGYFAALPKVYYRDYAETQMKKRIKQLDWGYIAGIGDTIEDKDCDILEVYRSKNFDAWNITAIIENKMVSWMSSKCINPGACVVLKAKVKDHTVHQKNLNHVTRLNYVKAFQ